MTAGLLGYTVALFPSGAAVDGFGEKTVLSAGLGALALAVVGLSFAPSYNVLLLGGIVLVLFTGLGITIYGSLGVFYSCLGVVVKNADIGAATAGAQTATNIGGLLAPPAFGSLVELSGYSSSWALLCVATLLAAVSFAIVRHIL